jgi:tetratricopeptide (TPR) repeat protein
MDFGQVPLPIRTAAAAFLLSLAALAQTNEPGQLDASPALFSVMSAINAAGYDADLESPSNSPLRAQVRAAIAARKPPVLPELREYFKAHRQRDWTAELSQYVSFALSVDGPPEFKYRYKPHELPPDVLPLETFRSLLQRFHREAGIDELWRKAQPAIEETIRRYQKPSIDALMTVNAYLRNAGGGTLGSRFQIYVDLLGAPNNVQTRSYRNEYFIVVTPSAEPQAEDIRHGYLHYLVDPMGVRFADELNKKKPLSDYAQGAPALDQFYKDDFLLLATESLIKAIEARLAPPASRQSAVNQALSEGFVLAGAFADALAAYEKQEQALRFYFAEMVNGIDLKRETARLDQVQFAAEKAQRKSKVVPAERKVERSGIHKSLEEADQAYDRRDLDAAKGIYLRVLKETDDQPLHARAYYGLAKIATLQNNAELAVQLFERTLRSAPDDYVKGWSLVYLGRLADAAGDRDKASQHYQAALAVPGAAVTARKAAEQGLQKAFQK